VSNVTDMNGLFTGGVLSTENYDLILKGWSQLESLQHNLVIKINSHYSPTSADARAILTDIYGWEIEDLGPMTLH